MIKNALKYNKVIIDLQIHDLDRAVSFYRDTLGLPLIHRANDWASFDVAGAEIHLYLHGGVEYGLEFQVDNIVKEAARLKARGVWFYTEANQPHLINILPGDIMEFPWGKTSLFRDSEGNQLALVEENIQLLES